MKVYPTNQIRNIGIMAHGGSGKTSLTEALLYNSGITNRLGKVDNGNTVTDYSPEEIERKVTINLTMAPIEWQENKINILDTPGYADFFGEVTSAMRVIDSAVLVVCAVAGVEVQTEVIWDYMDEKDLPRVCFFNKMDRENADYYRVLEELKGTFNKNIVPFHLPIGKEADFSGIIDIINNTAYKFVDGKPEVISMPEEMSDEVNSYKEQLLEAVAESDDELLIKYLEGEDISSEEYKKGLISGIKNNNFVPVLCGSAINNIGTNLMLDFLVDYMPSPDERMGSRPKELENEHQSAIVFKTLADPYVGKVSFFKVYGGIFKSNANIFNSRQEEEEKITNIYTMRGKNLEQVDEIKPGDFGAVTKLVKTTTGDTLTTKNNPKALEGIALPEPTLSYAIKTKNKGDEDKLGNAISRILDEDKTVKFEKNLETKETIITCMGEMHLDVITEKLKKRYGVEVETKIPTVPYRETIRSKVEKIEGKYKKQTGGHGQYGHVYINLEPNPDSNFLFEEKIFGGAVPKQYIPGVEKGIKETMQEGVLAGYPVTNFTVTLIDGSYHPVDSSELAFKVAGSLAFKKAMEQAEPMLLEPIMKVTIKVPEHFMGDIMGDINGKRGRILGMEPQGKFQIINAMVPLSEMYRYANDLKSITQGRGVFSMEFSKYEEVPPHIAEKIIEEAKKQKEEQ